MSVDTNMVGKRVERYTRFSHHDVEFLVPGNIKTWSGELRVDAKRTAMGTKRFVIDAIHSHAPG